MTFCPCFKGSCVNPARCHATQIFRITWTLSGGTAWLVTDAVQRRGCYKSLIWILGAEFTYLQKSYIIHVRSCAARTVLPRKSEGDNNLAIIKFHFRVFTRSAECVCVRVCVCYEGMLYASKKLVDWSLVCKYTSFHKYSRMDWPSPAVNHWSSLVGTWEHVSQLLWQESMAGNMSSTLVKGHGKISVRSPQGTYLLASPWYGSA